MSSFDMSLVNEALIGVDHKHTVTAYVLRDKLMNLTPNEQIVSCMNKLGYVNINFPEETKKFLIELTMTELKLALLNNWESGVKYVTVEEYMEQMKATDDYKNFIKQMNYRLKRACELTSFLNSNDNEYFYNSLTLEELAYVGY